jgi:hypothetical protein
MIERGLSSTVLAHVMGHRDATTTEREFTGSDFLMDGGVTASYFYGQLAPQ